MRRVLTPKWLLVHAGVLGTVVGFLALGWWQLSRAVAGNILSFGYAFEWPVFAGFVIFVWTREVRRALAEPASANPLPTGVEPVVADSPHPGAVRGAGRQRGAGYRGRTGPAYDDSDDESLAAYNHYLAWLNAHPHATPADYPG